MEEKFGDYIYDGKFEGNVLIVGRTGCGKTAFIQKLGQNKILEIILLKFFGFQKFFLLQKGKIQLEIVL